MGKAAAKHIQYDGIHKETTRTARTIQNFFINTGVNHLNDHFHNISGREELASIATQVGSNNFFVRFTLDVDIGVEPKGHLLAVGCKQVS